jgi:hypothetical protein
LVKHQVNKNVFLLKPFFCLVHSVPLVRKTYICRGKHMSNLGMQTEVVFSQGGLTSSVIYMSLKYSNYCCEDDLTAN